MIQKIDYSLIRGKLETGDLVFFSGYGFTSEIIKKATGSEWSHVGMVIVVDLLDLVLLWESTTLSNLDNLQTGEPTKGVQIVPLSMRTKTYDGYYGFRRLGLPAKIGLYHLERTLKTLRRELDGKPYEKSSLELLRSSFSGIGSPSRSDLSSIFCSELVAEALIRLEVLPKSSSNSYDPGELAEYDFF